MSAICAHQLNASRKWLGTRIPDSVITTLAAVHDQEPSAAYLRPNRRWSDELISSIGGLSRWGDRLRLLREVVLPDPTYMLQRDRTSRGGAEKLTFLGRARYLMSKATFTTCRPGSGKAE